MYAKIKEFFEKNLRNSLQKEAKEKLGDRSSYIGSSDISGCPLAAYWNKIEPVLPKMEKLIVFERGHMVENLIEKMLGNLSFKREVEFSLEDEIPVPIRVHIDYLIYNKKTKSVTILEVKSTKNQICLYPSYLMQVNLQWLVAERNLKKKGWKVKNAYVVVVNPNTGEYEIFEIEKDEKLQELALEKASILAEALIKKAPPKGEVQLYCSSCQYKQRCPEYNKGAINQDFLYYEIKEIVEMEKKKKELEEKIKKKKESLLRLLKDKEIKKAKVMDWQISITAESSYKTLDLNKLKKENPELWEQLLEKYGKEITRKASLKIK